MPFAIFSTGCSADRALRRLAAAVALLCGAVPYAFAANGSRVAVFPPVDRTGRSAAVDHIHESLELSLALRGFDPIPRADLEEFFSRHRIRYMGGISPDIARAIGEETGVDGVLITSVDDWEIVEPPRFALTSRWVSADSDASVAWIGTTAHHGHERPGIFGLGLVSSIEILLLRASDEIAASLAASDRSAVAESIRRVPDRFRPGTFAVDPEWAASVASGRTVRVAVLPFLVEEGIRDTGEILANQLVRWLLATGRLEVLEPGVVREALLQARVIQEGGPSLPQVDALRALLDVDLIVSGRVTDYEPMGSSPGSPFVGFSVRGIDVHTRQAVWTSFSFAHGDDRLGPFGTSRIRSSITLTSDLVGGAVASLEEEFQSRAPRQASAAQVPPAAAGKDSGR